MTDSRKEESGDRGFHQFISDETDEWATPPEFVRPLAEAIGGFDLDPASGAERSPVADETYTEADDGLHTPWYGRTWVNPPYSEMEAWVERAIGQHNAGNTELIVMLCKGDSSTDWWQRAVVEADTIAMLDSRLEFGDAGNGAPFPSHVFVFGDANDGLVEVLERRGVVFRGTDRVRTTVQRRLTA
jgi:phage N-6-adenine-methyltransferase